MVRIDEFLEDLGYERLELCSPYVDYRSAVNVADALIKEANRQAILQRYNPLVLEEDYFFEDENKLFTILLAHSAPALVIVGYEVFVKPGTPVAREVSERLQDYPLLSDDIYSELECELIESAWEDWLAYDLDLDPTDQKAKNAVMERVWELFSEGEVYVSSHGVSLTLRAEEELAKVAKDFHQREASS